MRSMLFEDDTNLLLSKRFFQFFHLFFRRLGLTIIINDGQVSAVAPVSFFFKEDFLLLFVFLILVFMVFVCFCYQLDLTFLLIIRSLDNIF